MGLLRARRGLGAFHGDVCANTTGKFYVVLSELELCMLRRWLLVLLGWGELLELRTAPATASSLAAQPSSVLTYPTAT